MSLVTPFSLNGWTVPLIGFLLVSILVTYPIYSILHFRQKATVKFVVLFSIIDSPISKILVRCLELMLPRGKVDV